MDDKKQELFHIKWTQDYAGWESLRDDLTETLLECSDMAEAKAVIAHVQHLK